MQISFIYIYISSLLNLCDCPVPPISVITACQAGLRVLYSSFPLVIHFTHGRVPMLMLLSQFVLISPSPAVSASPFSRSASPFHLCKEVHWYCFSRLYIYIFTLIYCICFSLTLLCITEIYKIYI